MELIFLSPPSPPIFFEPPPANNLVYLPPSFPLSKPSWVFPIFHLPPSFLKNFRLLLYSISKFEHSFHPSIAYYSLPPLSLPSRCSSSPNRYNIIYKGSLLPINVFPLSSPIILALQISHSVSSKVLINFLPFLSTPFCFEILLFLSSSPLFPTWKGYQ